MADDTWNIAQTALISAINAEIQGMIAENQICAIKNKTVKYDDTAFFNKAEELYGIYHHCMEVR
jgi:hypothetical protein